MPPQLVLASTSPYRRDLLSRLMLGFTQVAPPVDERDVQQSGLPPAEIASELAQRKALAVAQQLPTHPRSVVIGADQLVAFNGVILGKPGDRDGAIAQLTRLAGETHELVTAVAVTDGTRIAAQINLTRMRMRRLTAGQIARYVDCDHPFDCAGSYKFEAHGIALFDEVSTSDASAITGLPLLVLARMLEEFGFTVPGNPAESLEETV
jgi:septum formation protein